MEYGIRYTGIWNKVILSDCENAKLYQSYGNILTRSRERGEGFSAIEERYSRKKTHFISTPPHLSAAVVSYHVLSCSHNER
jgi:hypothetical protein